MDTAKRVIRLQHGQDRFNERIPIGAKSSIDRKVSGKDERFTLTPGDSLLAPRGIPHTYAHLGEGQGRMLIAYQPAGDMEAFFLEMSKLAGMPSPDEVQRIFRAHGMEVVGPALKV